MDEQQHGVSSSSSVIPTILEQVISINNANNDPLQPENMFFEVFVFSDMIQQIHKQASYKPS